MTDPGRADVGEREVTVLEFAILGLLHESPMHGYVLRKRLNVLLGSLRAFSYGSLYPALRRMQAAGWISVEDPDATSLGRRSRVVYTLTAEGKEHFAELLGEAGPSAWDDEGFGVRFAFFGRTDAATRLRILEGRRQRLEERREGVRSALGRTRERLDRYTLELQNHGLESVEREVRWLNELIETERTGRPTAMPVSTPIGPAPRPRTTVPQSPADPRAGTPGQPR